MQQSIKGLSPKNRNSGDSLSIEESKFQLPGDIEINESEKVVHSYKMINYIGHGAFGKVYLGENT